MRKQTIKELLENKLKTLAEDTQKAYEELCKKDTTEDRKEVLQKRLAMFDKELEQTEMKLAQY